MAHYFKIYMHLILIHRNILKKIEKILFALSYLFIPMYFTLL